tara:strand:+ start:840 stop:1175 length:336 start_codon:yes stop_codon:yes gene_type:complete
MSITINKREIIAEKIGEIENTEKIIKFVEENKINYSSNMNGFFINISILDDKYIDELYSLINILLNDNNDIHPDITNETMPQSYFKVESKKDKIYTKFQLSPMQVNILELI